MKQYKKAGSGRRRENKCKINRSIKAKVENQKKWDTKREVWRQYSETDFKIRK
jgi:hypothetical protein